MLTPRYSKTTDSSRLEMHRQCGQLLTICLAAVHLINRWYKRHRVSRDFNLDFTALRGLFFIESKTCVCDIVIIKVLVLPNRLRLFKTG
jgi:hypothetical protein